MRRVYYVHGPRCCYDYAKAGGAQTVAMVSLRDLKLMLAVVRAADKYCDGRSDEVDVPNLIALCKARNALNKPRKP